MSVRTPCRPDRLLRGGAGAADVRPMQSSDALLSRWISCFLLDMQQIRIQRVCFLMLSGRKPATDSITLKTETYHQDPINCEADISSPLEFFMYMIKPASPDYSQGTLSQRSQHIATSIPARRDYKMVCAPVSVYCS
jgi:hypothetical protein